MPLCFVTKMNIEPLLRASEDIYEINPTEVYDLLIAKLPPAPLHCFELLLGVTSAGFQIINHPPGNFTFQSHFADVGNWKDFHFIK